jgi:hypothetical protein
MRSESKHCRLGVLREPPLPLPASCVGFGVRYAGIRKYILHFARKGSCVDGPPLARTFLKLRYIAGRCGHVSGLFMRPYHVPLAIMLFARLRLQSIPRTRNARPTVGFPEPAVSTGFVHSLPFALPNHSGAYKAPILCRDQICKDRFAIAFSARHQRPDYARQFIGQGNRRDFGRAARYQFNEPRAARPCRSAYLITAIAPTTSICLR